jgi:protein involved in polysaccharide export with SLBB domain
MRALIVATCLLLSTGSAPAQQPAANPAPAASSPRTTIDESLGTIENRDLLRVRITGLRPSPTPAEKWVRVDDDGLASLPYVGGQKLAGVTTAQAEAAIAKAYQTGGFIQHAQVDVRRIEAGSRVSANLGKLAKGDLVAVTVDDLTGPGVPSEFRAHVGADGELPIPLIGAPKVDGMTQLLAEQTIAKEFQSRGVVRDAIVGVRVIEPAETSKLKPGPIAKGDLLSVVVYDLTGPGRRSEFQARVGADGSFGFPWIGMVQADGLSEARAADAVVKALRDNKVEASAMVSVHRLESADQANVKLGPVAPGEVLRISITELAGPGVETVKTVKVAGDGHIAMPLVGAIKLEGLSEAEAARAIAKTYRDKHLIQSAQVTVLKVNGAAPLPDEELEPLPDATLPAQPRQARR